MVQVDGSLYVVYNVGLSSQPVGELEFKVNDGKYHVLRFARRGQNASVQLDDRPPHFKHPPGQLTAFSSTLLIIYLYQLLILKTGSSVGFCLMTYDSRSLYRAETVLFSRHDFRLLAEQCNCIAKFGYYYNMTSLVYRRRHL